LNKQRFLVVGVIIVVAMLTVGLAWVYVYSPQAPETCSPFREEVLAIGFKGDVIMFGILGAFFSALLYGGLSHFSARLKCESPRDGRTHKFGSLRFQPRR
jgi:hypothetical protein